MTSTVTGPGRGSVQASIVDAPAGFGMTRMDRSSDSQPCGGIAEAGSRRLTESVFGALQLPVESTLKKE